MKIEITRSLAFELFPKQAKNIEALHGSRVEEFHVEYGIEGQALTINQVIGKEPRPDPPKKVERIKLFFAAPTGTVGKESMEPTGAYDLFAGEGYTKLKETIEENLA